MSTTISARKLTDILATLPDTNPLSFSKKGDHVVLSSGKSKFELQTISAEEFPVITEVDLEHAFTMSCLRFKYLLNMVSFACAVNNVRYFLNGVYICAENNKVRGVATDGHRLALCDVEAEKTADKKLDAILPRKTVKELVRLIPDSQDPIEVTFPNVKSNLNSSESRFYPSLLKDVTRTISESFPNTMKKNSESDVRNF